MADAIDFKFCPLVGHLVGLGTTDCPSNGHVYGHVINFKFRGPNHPILYTYRPY